MKDDEELVACNRCGEVFNIKEDGFCPNCGLYYKISLD